MEKRDLRAVIYKYLWIIFLFIGVCGFIYIFFFTSHKMQVKSVWSYYFKILIFLFISIGLAFFPNKSRKSYLWMVIPLLIYAGFVGSKLDYIGFRQLMRGIDAGNEYYTTLYLILYPFIVFIAAFGYRIGGGTSGKVLKITIVGVLILFSSFLNLMFEIINNTIPTGPIPYQYYFQSLFGHFPTFTEEIIFCICHIPIVVGILFLPLDKWINKIFPYETGKEKTPPSGQVEK